MTKNEAQPWKPCWTLQGIMVPKVHAVMVHSPVSIEMGPKCTEGEKARYWWRLRRHRSIPRLNAALLMSRWWGSSTQ